jgi:hypothetical protein
MLKRLRLALADLTEDDEHHSVTIAARELCKLADIALSVFTQAIKALKERNLVTVRHGGNRRQSAYQVNFFKTICASNLDAPPLENTALVRAALASDFDATTLSLIDHVFSAKPRRLAALLHGQVRPQRRRQPLPDRQPATAPDREGRCSTPQHCRRTQRNPRARTPPHRGPRALHIFLVRRDASRSGPTPASYPTSNSPSSSPSTPSRA